MALLDVRITVRMAARAMSAVPLSFNQFQMVWGILGQNVFGGPMRQDE